MSLPKNQTEHSVQFNNEINVVLSQIYFTFLILSRKSYFDWKKSYFIIFLTFVCKYTCQWKVRLHEVEGPLQLRLFHCGRLNYVKVPFFQDVACTWKN